MKLLKHHFLFFGAIALAACGEVESPLPPPLTFSPVTGAAAERIQFSIDAQLDNYLANIERTSGVQGKISLAEAHVKTTNQQIDRIVRFEHPELCYDNTCPFILLTQNKTSTNELDRWNLDLMMNGTTFAIGNQVRDGRYDLFITRNVDLPRYYYDAHDSEGPTYLLDTTFRYMADE